ncbi:MAG: hypothetical protein HY081_01970 [Gammaproteobacteria bacterium]|nr:hypothetical protein [Gammaproteobacteria bacterium]
MLTPNATELLNRHCHCHTLDSAALDAELTAAGEEFEQLMMQQRPHLFSAATVFVSPEQHARLQPLIEAIESVIALPAYQSQAMARAPAIARLNFGARGVFLGYDFHLTPAGPRLIEINTNAGGALLSTMLRRNQLDCCSSWDAQREQAVDEKFLSMFLAEWRQQRGAATLKRIAIVDDAPSQQYLYPEFLLFQRLFAAQGIDALIVDARQLRHVAGALWADDKKIDLVYNRLTDFYLAAPEHAALRTAYIHDEVVLTPHPRAHALYADKRNLVWLSDADVLKKFGVSSDTIATLLAGIPRTRIVEPAQAEALWAQRRELFFKPFAGYASKAVYRGDKLSKRVWREILAGQYVAQQRVPPAQRRLAKDTELKFDLRAYVYHGDVQLLSARLYQGQTTNFRTPGGGFAPVSPPDQKCLDICTA